MWLRLCGGDLAVLDNAYHAQPMPIRIHNVGRYGLSTDYANLNLGGVAWPGANRALYFPVRIPRTFPVARGFVIQNGNAAGTQDIGVYDQAGNRLTNIGATARSSNVCQHFDVTDVVLGPGVYYFALLGSSTSGTYDGLSMDARYLRAHGVLQEDVGATSLPSTMTPATVGQGTVPIFGFTSSATL